MSNFNNVEQLQVLLADYSVFYQKLRNYHWNVTGPMFFELHVKFEELYTDAALKVDELAERIVTKHGRVPATLAEYLKLSRLKEGQNFDAKTMVEDLVSDIETLNAALRDGSASASSNNDAATANLLEGFADQQEKTVWMFRAFLK